MAFNAFAFSHCHHCRLFGYLAGRMPNAASTIYHLPSTMYISSCALSLLYPYCQSIFIFARSALLETRFPAARRLPATPSPCFPVHANPAIKFTQISAQVRPAKGHAFCYRSMWQRALFFGLSVPVLVVVFVAASCGLFILPEIVATGCGIMFSSLYRNFGASRLS